MEPAKNGGQRLEIPRPIGGRLLISVGTSAALFILGALRDTLHGQQFAITFWLGVAGIWFVYSFVTARRTLLLIWQDFVQVDDWNDSFLFDRSRQSFPEVDPEDGVVRIGTDRIEIGSRIDEADTALIEQSFRLAMQARPQHLKTRNPASGRWAHLLVVPLVLLMVGFSFILEFSQEVGLVLTAILGVGWFAGSELWRKSRPRLVEAPRGSG